MRGWLLAVVVLMGCGATRRDACAVVLEAACSRYEACLPGGVDATGCRSMLTSKSYCLGPDYDPAVRSWPEVEACRDQLAATACADVPHLSVACLEAALRP